MNAIAVVLEAPERLALRSLALHPVEAGDVVVDIAWSGISTGTERLLFQGKMPNFPGMGYPLVPGYESVGRIVDAGHDARNRIGEWVFVPGANCFDGARGLFGGSASRVQLASPRVVPVPESIGVDGIMLALAATAYHAISGHDAPELIVGHGALGRLIARVTVALGAPPPLVWDTNSERRKGARGYPVSPPGADQRQDYRTIYDASGVGALDMLIGRLAKGGELVLAGFYDQPLQFAFPPAFMREARIRIAAEFTTADLNAVIALIADGRLSLDGLVSEVRPAAEAETAYPHAFTNPQCLKMALDWNLL
jgi:bacteriochlorophyllide a dehydrogenase